MNIIGEAIREELKREGLTQEKASKELGVDRTALSKYINGHLNVPSDIKNKMINDTNSARLLLAFNGSTFRCVDLDGVKKDFYTSSNKLIEELEEIIESIKKVQKFFHNAESIEDLNDKQVEKIEKMMEEVGDGFFACITIDSICSDMGADLKKRNLRCLIKYHERGYLSDSIFKEALQRNGLSQDFIDKYEDAKDLREAL
jgi:transcriptional regulator with XRE-family HTH domain